MTQTSHARQFQPCIWCTQPIEVGRDKCGFCGRSQYIVRLYLAFGTLALVGIGVALWWWFR